MFFKKLFKLNLIALGALNGLILGSLSITPFAFFCAFDDCKGYENLAGGGTIDFICGCKYVDWLLPIELSLIVTIASFLVRLTIYKRIDSRLLLWQIIGVVSFPLYFLYIKLFYSFVNYWRVCLNNTDLIVCRKPSVEENLKSLFEVNQGDLFSLAIVFSVLIVFNLLFAYIIDRIFLAKTRFL